MDAHPGPEKEIKKSIERFFHAMDTCDLESMEQLIAHDVEMVHIGTGADEVWRGWNDLRQATLEQFEALEYYKAEIMELQINLSASGDVAWYSHLLDARIKSDGQDQRWKGARFTGVLEKRKNRWVIVQTHVSIPESAASRNY